MLLSHGVPVLLLLGLLPWWINVTNNALLFNFALSLSSKPNACIGVAVTSLSLTVQSALAVLSVWGGTCSQL